MLLFTLNLGVFVPPPLWIPIVDGTTNTWTAITDATTNTWIAIVDGTTTTWTPKG